MVTCSACGFSNPPGSAFCDNCGSSISASPASPINSPMQAPIPSVNYQQPPNYGAAPSTIPAMPLPNLNQGGGVTCNGCGTINPPGSVFCDSCGSGLSGGPVAAQPGAMPPYSPPLGQTVLVSQAAPAPIQPPVSSGPIAARLVGDKGEIPISIAPGKPLMIGRKDEVSGNFPEVDLSGFDAHLKGVGRKHAQLILEGNQLYVQDLGSVNFSYVNSQQITPNSRAAINHGDELRLGLLTLKYFVG